MQPEKPQAADADAGQTQPSEPPAQEGNPLKRVFWTKRRLGIAGGLATDVAAPVLWWPWDGSEPKIAYSFTKAA